MEDLYNFIKNQFGISENVLDYSLKKEKEIANLFIDVDHISEYNQLKVLSAMQKNKLSDIHFAATTGYG